MPDSNYTSPKADLTPETKGGSAFFTVSPAKLLFMLITTSGLYGVYWFYKNWALYKHFSGRSIWPVPRAVFSWFFFPSLLSKVDRVHLERGKGGMPWWKLIAVLFILIVFSPWWLGFLDGFIRALTRQPSLLAIDAGPIGLLLFSLAQITLYSLLLMRVQRFINVVNDDPSGSSNAELSGANWLWVVVGLLFWYGNYLALVVLSSPSL
ncbi:hypothetical protein [Pseudomonas huanghezhanensis]|uniref:hypothetical protein n=1 Tax=Pseudomonas huanghezhanensis TaxID=3002903 RepID=UPI0022860F74|nr:hypothetical protein [Pseudomonas sp. BSw22131]